MKTRKCILALATAIVATLLFGVAAMAAASVVTPVNMRGWGFIQESLTGSGALVLGPKNPPLGHGSANLTVDGTGGVIIGIGTYRGLPLDEITTLKYSTYRASGGTALAITLQLNIDYDPDDTQHDFQGRLVYEPYHTQNVALDEWQTWNALNDSAGTGTGNWWFTPGSGYRPGAAICSQSNPCTWAEVLTAFPKAEIHPTLGAVVLKAGGGWTGGFNGNVDALTINSDTYDFEFADVPTSKDECKGGGWKKLTDENGEPFKNQGDCIQYANTGK